MTTTATAATAATGTGPVRTAQVSTRAVVTAVAEAIDDKIASLEHTRDYQAQTRDDLLAAMRSMTVRTVRRGAVKVTLANARRYRRLAAEMVDAGTQNLQLGPDAEITDVPGGVLFTW